MSDSQQPQVEAVLLGERPGRPPLRRLQLDVTLRNPADGPRWFVLPRKLPAPGGGVDGLEADEWTGQGRVVVGRFMGTGGFHAVRLAAGAEIRIKGLDLSLWEDPPGGSTLVYDAVVAFEVKIGGAPAIDWFDADPTAQGSATVDRGELFSSRQPEDNKERPVELVDAQRIRIEIEL